jgi:hypothetical protein
LRIIPIKNYSQTAYNQSPPPASLLLVTDTKQTKRE